MEKVDKYRKRVRGYAGFFILLGLLQILLAIGGSFSPDFLTYEHVVAYAISGAVLVSAGLMAWNGSRTGAVVVLIWFGQALLVQFLVGSTGGVAIVRTAIYLLLAMLMCREAFRHWQAAREAGLDSVRGWGWLRWAGLVVIAPCASLSALGIGVMLLSQQVSAQIVSGRDIPENQLTWMREQGFLYANETPLLFYSDGIASIAEDGNLLTDRYVGSWWTDEEGEIQSLWGRLGTVCDVAYLEKRSDSRLRVYEVRLLKNEGSFELWLPLRDELRPTFLQRLDYLNDLHSNEELQAACEEDRAVDWDEVSRLNGMPVGLVRGEVLEASVRNWLMGEDFLLAGENPVWFYTNARYELAEGGTLMTDSYFGGWELENGEIDAIWFAHGELCKIEEIQADAESGSKRYKVSGPGEERWFEFSLPFPDAKPAERVEQLRQLTADYQTPEQAEACETGIDPLLVEEAGNATLPDAEDVGSNET